MANIGDNNSEFDTRNKSLNGRMMCLIIVFHNDYK